MQGSADLIRVCRAAAIRLTVQRAVRAGARVSMFALAIACGVSVLGVVVPVALPLAWALVVSVAVGGLGMVLAASWRPVRVQGASQLLDRRLDFHERTSTALELASSPVPSPLGARVMSDALTHLYSVDLRRVFPLRVPREAWAAGVLALLLVLSSVGLRGIAVPGTPAGSTVQQIQEEGKRIAAVAQALQVRARAEQAPQTRRLTSQLHDLGERLQHDRVDRAEALARIGDLSQQAERARRQVSDRLEATQPPSRSEGVVPPNLLRRQALEQQIKQLRELEAQLNQELTPADRQKLLDRLAVPQGAGQAGSAPVQRQLGEARDQLQQGNVAQAGRAVGEALRDLEGLRALIADEEGLRNVQQQLQQSRANLASGPSGTSPRGGVEPGPQSGRPPVPSGTSAPAPDPAGDPASPSRGPYPGVTAGSGVAPDKLGLPSGRLQGPKSPERLRGTQGDGEVSASEVVGAARPGTSHTPLTRVSPAIVPQADRYMERASVPARYRQLVRAYFERLARLR